MYLTEARPKYSLVLYDNLTSVPSMSMYCLYASILMYGENASSYLPGVLRDI